MSLYTDIYCKYKVGDLVSVINSPPIERGRVGVVKEITCKSYAISNTVKFSYIYIFLVENSLLILYLKKEKFD